MYIRELKIKNFRTFGDPPFCMSLKPFTLILGENNIGKTNLLNALALIFSQEITIYRKRLLEVDDINYHTVEKFKKEIIDFSINPEDIVFPEVSIEVILTDVSEKQRAAASLWPLSNDKGLSEFKITYCFSLRHGFDKLKWILEIRDRIKDIPSDEQMLLIDIPINDYRYNLFGGDDKTNKCDFYYLNMFRMDLLDALRNAQEELIASGNSRLLFRILTQRDEANYDDLKKILSSLDEEIGNNQNLKNVIYEVETLLEQVSLQNRSEDNKVGFKFSSPDTSEILKKLSMQYGNHPVDVGRNGLGRNNLLYLSLILSHLSAEELQNKDVVFRLIAIEEPESHLHPHLQDHISRNIEEIQAKSKGVMQLILTSHSTHIASKLKLNNSVILYLDEQDHHIKHHYIFSGLDSKKNKKDIRYLSKFINATNSRMFFSRKIILVEGISEQILIPLFFQNFFNTSIEKMGCEIINVNGVSFIHFIRLIKAGYYIKCLVITDSDSNTARHSRADRLKEIFVDDPNIMVTISESSTFEKDLIIENMTGEGRELIEEAIIATRPILGKRMVRDFSGRELDPKAYFLLIEEYKSEFSLNLKELLSAEDRKFSIPEYITNGYQFLK